MYDAKLSYEEAGEGLPMLLVHGFPFDRRIWKEQLDSLGDVARLIAVDLPGFGRSAEFPREAQPRMDDYAQTMADLAADLGLSKLVLVGHSMGGYVAMAFARRHAHMLAGLVLVSTRRGMDTRVARQNRLTLAEDVGARGPQAVVVAMLSKLFAVGTVGRDPGLADRLQEVMMQQSGEGIVKALRTMAGRRASGDVLKSLDVPTLVIAGAEDQIIRARTTRSIASQVRGAKYASVRGTGHMPMMEAPDQFNKLLRDFRCSLPGTDKPPACA